MSIALPEQLLQQAHSLVVLFVLSTARPLGLGLLFVAFAWGNLKMRLLRFVFAVAVALPVIMPFVGAPGGAMENLSAPVLILLVKELLLGALVGFVATLPIAIAGGGGSIIDYYRGSFQGAADPSGGQITPYSQLFVIISLWMFAALGGFWILTDSLYATYKLWPMFDMLPKLDFSGFEAFLLIVKKLMRGALALAAPVLVMMMMSDFAFLISAKMGKQINVVFHAFAMKNLIAILILPAFVFVVVRVVRGELAFLGEIGNFIRAAVE